MNRQPQEKITEKEQIKKIASGVFIASINSYAMPLAVFLLGIIVWGGNYFGAELLAKLKAVDDMKITLTRIDTNVKNQESRLIRVENALDKRRN